MRRSTSTRLMEEEMMITASPKDEVFSQDPITSSTACPSWKLYENPFYNSHHHHYYHHHHHRIKKHSSNKHHIHHPPLHFPVSARRVAASFWDISFFKPIMDAQDLNLTRTQVMELKTELELERALRMKLESMNKKLAKELSEERKGREALEKVCEELANERYSEKEEIEKMKKEIEDERKMMKMSEVLREERVQMKLSDAKFLYEEKLLELEDAKSHQLDQISKSFLHQAEEISEENTHRNSFSSSISSFGARIIRQSSARSSSDNSSAAAGASSTGMMILPRKSASPETENPHIKRGIKGFVEFPRVVRAIGSKSRHLGTKMECQKAQLQVLLKHKSPIRSNNLISS